MIIAHTISIRQAEKKMERKIIALQIFLVKSNTPTMLGPFKVNFSSNATLPFQCARYCGPVIAGFDKSSVKFYAIEGSRLILPVAFSFGSVEASLELPLWCGLVLKGCDECTLLPVPSYLVTAPSVTLKWFSALGGPFRSQFAWEEVLPELLTAQRPLCNGCLIPVSLAGRQFLLQVLCEKEGFFSFDLSSGDLQFIEDLETINLSEPLKKELELVKLQMSMTTASNIFFLKGVTFAEQEAVLQYLGVRKRVDLLALIPEEPFEGAEDLITEPAICYGLGGVELLGESLLEAVLRRHRGGNLVFVSVGNASLLLDRLAARFNFILWRNEVKSSQLRNWKENTLELLMKSGWSREQAQAHLKQSLTHATFKTLTPSRTAFYGYSGLRDKLLKFFLDPLLKREAYEALGLPLTPPGLILHGPSGIGKTALLHSLLSSPQISTHYTVLHVPCGASLLSRYLGGTEANLRELFTQARANRPCIIFIDQIASFGRKRSLIEPDGDGTGGGKQRYLSTLLNELDGIGGSEGVTVVATCLELEELDEALLRPGRLEKHVLMPLPGAEDVKDLLEVYGFPDEEWTEGMTCSQIICQLKRPK